MCVTNLAFESKSSILSVSEMAVALDEVLARELERGRRLRCGLRTAADDVVSTLASVTLMHKLINQRLRDF